MATLEEQLIGSLPNIVKDQTIQLDADVKKTTRTPLTFEQMQEILEKGGSIPEGFSLPTSLTMQQYSQLPGGLSAYQNLQGMGMMEAIKGTADFGKGPGGTTPEDPDEKEDPDEIVIHNCPSGFVFDTVQKICVPIQNNDRENDNLETAEQEALTKRSYQSFANMISNSDEYKKGDGTWDSFKDNMDKSWMGSLANTLFNDTDMLYSSWANTYGTNLNLLEQKQKGVPAFTTTKATVSEPTVSEPEGPQVGTGIPGDPGSYDSNPNITAPTPFDSNFIRKPDSGPTYTSIKESVPSQTFDKPDRTAGKPDKKPDSGPTYTSIKESVPSQTFDKPDRTAGKTFDSSFKEVGTGERGDPGSYFNEGGFVENSNTKKPLQLADVSLKMQEGGQVPVAPPQEAMPMPSGQPAGFVNDPSAAPAPDNTMDAMQGEGQKDDVMGELPEGTFVINAMAVQLAGIEELDNMVEKAYETLSENMREKGVDENLVTQLVGSSRSRAGMKEQMVDVAVSNGEYIVPPEIVPIIGEDKLRKINDRGLRKLEKEKKQEKKQPQAPMMMDKGGFVIATDPDGKILTEKVKDKSGREVSRILSRDEVGSAEERAVQQGPRDGGSYQDVSTKDISKSKSFVRKITPDEMASNFKRTQEEEGAKVAGPETVVDYDQPSFGGGEKQLASDLGTPTFGSGEGQLAPTRRITGGGEGTRELTQGFIRPTGTGLETGDPEPPKTFSTDDLKEIAKQVSAGEDISGPDVPTFDVSNIKQRKTINITDQLRIVKQAYKNENTNLLEDIAEGRIANFDYDDSIRIRARELMLQLLEGKTINNKTKTEIEVDSRIENDIINNARDSRFNQFKRSTYMQQLDSNISNSMIGTSFDPNTGEYYSRGQGPRDDGSYQSFMKPLPDGNVQTIEDMEEFNPTTDNTVDQEQIKSFMEKRLLNKSNKFNVKAKKIATLDADNPIYIFNGDLSKNQVISIDPEDYEKTVPIRLRFALEMMNAESMGKVDAKSFSDAEGIFQLRRSIFGPAAPADAPGFNVKSATSETEYQDPEWQFNTAMDYVDAMLEKYNGNLEKAALAYNVGFAYVDKMGDDINYDLLEMIVREGIPEKGVRPKSYNVANRIVRYARQYIDKILKEGPLRNPPPPPIGKGFRVDVEPPVSKPKRIGGFV